MGQAISILAALAAIALLAAGTVWWRIAGGSEGPDVRPQLSVHRVRMAASATALAFFLLAALLGIVAFR